MQGEIVVAKPASYAAPVIALLKIKRYRSKLNSGTLVHDFNCLHEAQIQGNGS